MCHEETSLCMPSLHVTLSHVLLNIVNYYKFWVTKPAVMFSMWGVKRSMSPFCSRRNNVSYNKSSRFNAVLCGFLAIFLPAVFIISFLINVLFPDDLGALVGEGLAATLYTVMVSTFSYMFEHVYVKIYIVWYGKWEHLVCDFVFHSFCCVLFQAVVLYLWEWIPEDGQVVAVMIFGVTCYFFFFLARYFAR